MDKSFAKQIIEETFESSFDKDKFLFFIRNLLNKIDESKAFHARGYVKEKFKDISGVIKTYERLGTYTDPAGKRVDVLVVYLKKDNSLDRARTTLRNFVADYLKQRAAKEASLAAFVPPNKKDWRFSFIKMEYKLAEDSKGRPKGVEEFTPARRYSFLVGEGESSHTAKSRLKPILEDDRNKPPLEQIEETFSVESVTKEFFGKYRDLFLRLKENLDVLVNKDSAIKNDFQQKNVNPIDFAKKLLGQIVFLYFLQKKGWFGVRRHEEWGSGSKRFLRELFEKKHGGYKNFFNDILEPLFYEALRLERPGDYYSRFDCRIPFLNGGLFDPINDYDWWNTDILLPDEIFSNKRKTKEGDIGDGILDVFDRYNFTVKEDEPLEKEVAVDPEMLGKVFENLLEVKDRKSKGTYYTPREIVHYMCQESLSNYLTTELDGKVSKEDIDRLIKYGESVVEHDSRVVNKGWETERYSFKLPGSVRKHAKLIDEKLTSIRVCDPAAGSGAFLVGMMNEIIRSRNALTSYIGENGERTSYNFKQQAIQNCLYGVDIDPGAVEIAKLRLWLSLIVDEEERESIQPLPNLDYKIVQGNSLLSVEKNLFNQQLFNQLEELKPLFFNETSASKKQKYKKQIDDLISQITNGHEDFDFEVYFSEVFHEKKGLDVVIANPPYITLSLGKKQKYFTDEEIRVFRKNYSSVLEYKGNTFALFIAKSIMVMSPKGTLAFIIPNTLLLNETFRNLRKYILEETKILDLLNIRDKVFESAEIGGNLVIILTKNKIDENYEVRIRELRDSKEFDFNQFSFAQINNFKTNPDYKFYLDSDNMNILAKLRENSIPLGKIVKFYQGIITGDNKKFLSNERKNFKFQKILRGRDIHKYYYVFDETYVLYEKEKLWSNTDENLYKVPEKLINRQTGSSLVAAYDNKQFFTLDSTHIQVPITEDFDLKFILGLFNSQLMNFYYNQLVKEQGRVFAQVKTVILKQLPIKKTTRIEQCKIVSIIDKILAITKDNDYLHSNAKQEKVREYEKQIDQLVYKLYGLTPEEIKIVNGSNQS